MRRITHFSNHFLIWRKLSRLLVLSFVLFTFSHCVSTKRYRELQLTYQTQQTALESLHTLEQRSQKLEEELVQTKAQLQKTENVLTSFYMKYGNKSNEILPSQNGDQLAKQLEDELKLAKIDLRKKDEEIYLLKKKEESLSKTHYQDLSPDKIPLWHKDKQELIELNNKLQQQERKIEELNKKSNAELEQQIQSEKLRASEQILSRDKVIEDITRNLDQMKLENNKLNLKNTELAQQILQENNKKSTVDFESQKIWKRKNDSILAEFNRMQINFAELTKEHDSIKKQLKEEKSQTQLLYNDLLSKNEQIEILGKKLSEQQSSNKKSNQIQSLKDSIDQKNSIIKLLIEQHANDKHQMQLSQSILRDSFAQSIQSQIAKSDRLEREIQQYKNDLSKSESALKSMPVITKENIDLKEQIRRLTEQQQRHLLKIRELESRPVAAKQNELPPNLINKVSSLPQEFPMAGVFYKIEGGKAHVFIPQSYLFEGESVAMKEAGTKLVSHLITNIKPAQDLSIEIMGFGVMDVGGQKSLDGNFRRANTIGKLIGALGISGDKVTIGARPVPSFGNETTLPAGVEIIFHPK